MDLGSYIFGVGCLKGVWLKVYEPLYVATISYDESSLPHRENLSLSDSGIRRSSTSSEHYNNIEVCISSYLPCQTRFVHFKYFPLQYMTIVDCIERGGSTLNNNFSLPPTYTSWSMGDSSSSNLIMSVNGVMEEQSRSQLSEYKMTSEM